MSNAVYDLNPTNPKIDIKTNQLLIDTNVDVSSGNVKILAKGTSASSTVYKAFMTLLEIR
jgi:hypothetical protein